MADKAKGIMDGIAKLFSQDEEKRAKPLTREYVAKNRQDIAKKFERNDDLDFNAKIKKAVGLE